MPIDAGARRRIRERLAAQQIARPYLVAHPGGGSNPGMTLESKRYPPAQLAALLDHVAEARKASLILLGGPDDSALVAEVAAKLKRPAVSWVGELSFAEIAALAAGALGYIGNDSGFTHLAAAAGAATVMIMGPTDPARYAPFTPNRLALWKPRAIDHVDLILRKRAPGIGSVMASALMMLWRRFSSFCLCADVPGQLQIGNHKLMRNPPNRSPVGATRWVARNR